MQESEQWSVPEYRAKRTPHTSCQLPFGGMYGLCWQGGVSSTDDGLLYDRTRKRGRAYQRTGDGENWRVVMKVYQLVDGVRQGGEVGDSVSDPDTKSFPTDSQYS